MAYFIFKRHGTRWDSMRLFAGPFDDYAAAETCFKTLPTQQRHSLLIVRDMRRQEALFLDGGGGRKLANQRR